jgi:hypothetical protein
MKAACKGKGLFKVQGQNIGLGEFEGILRLRPVVDTFNFKTSRRIAKRSTACTTAEVNEQRLHFLPFSDSAASSFFSCSESSVSM